MLTLAFTCHRGFFWGVLSSAFPDFSRERGGQGLTASLYSWLLHCQLCGSRSTAGTCSPMAQWLKNRPTGPETWVRSLGQEDPWRRKGMVTHSSILAWRIPWTEEPGGVQSMGLQRLRHNSVTNFIHIYKIYMKAPNRCHVI